MSRNRQTVLRWIFIPFLFFLWASPAWGAVYKWKDENGRLHFTDDITNVPKKFRPHYTNKKSKPRKKTEKPKTSLGEILKKNSAARDQQGTKPGYGKALPGMGQMEQEEFARELERSMEELAEELGRAFEGMGQEYEN
ncbi:MAG: DUF4124 domain-containing protein [Nitrospina sp.]|jgi:hypothetical protein|nr:DUF4124 domain-containing protein [Nitrospina sp.]MBT3414249.1 DUF4124 domain-containing protein [Nitrospina sp.]MBT3856066.1 DUF4124 domain-containing protein [Nitrospina sp.]MBT4104788.1 DUF4124 domain-containing protein [Nitrospina sp.]MBT4389171.1 DUF4124 domain-containing protein [Nitrospina sp.]